VRDPYQPVSADANWKSKVTAGLLAFEDDATITNVTANTFEVSRELSALPDGPPEWVEPWDCTDEGPVRKPSNSDRLILGIDPSGTETVRRVLVEGVTSPRVIQSGEIWIQIFPLELVTTEDRTLQATLTYEHTAVSTEEVRVHAGTFDALRLDSRAAWVSAGDPTPVTEAELTGWLVEDLGLVKWQSSAIGTGELVAYKVPEE
jgi:hypothetical protein